MKKKIKAWAEVGSHGGIFVFAGGKIAEQYPGLFHIYETQLTSDLIPVTIVYDFPPKKKSKKV